MKITKTNLIFLKNKLKIIKLDGILQKNAEIFQQHLYGIPYKCKLVFIGNRLSNY